MWVIGSIKEPEASRRKRLLNQRILKAKVLTIRVNEFIETINKSSFSESEKKQILSNLNIPVK